jgi:hypothetical protein
MAPAETQRRLALFGRHPPTLEVLLPALDRGRPFDLRRIETQQRLMENWDCPELVVIDHPASLTDRSGGDDGWPAVESFLRVQRRYGRAVVMVYHANRKGLPRGSSRREDLLDLVIGLRRPADWRASHGARFEVHFEKTRAIHGASLAPMVAQLETADGLACWRWAPADTDRFDRGVALLTQGLSVEAMARSLGRSRAWGFRLQGEARALGRLPKRKLRGAAA